MRHIAEFVAVLACGLFSEAAVYLSLVEHLARMECGVELAATEFAPSYRRATVMQASLAAVGWSPPLQPGSQERLSYGSLAGCCWAPLSHLR